MICQDSVDYKLCGGTCGFYNAGACLGQVRQAFWLEKLNGLDDDSTPNKLVASGARNAGFKGPN